MPRRPFLIAGLGLAVVAPLAFLGGPAAAAPTKAAPYDFNGDGRVDLAVGAPFLTNGRYAAGGVAVLAATGSGLSATAQVLTADSPGVVGESSADDELGASLASGDFDGDGFADLAVGVPVDYVRYEGAGSVTVLYGSAKGLTGARSLELLEPGGPNFDTAFGYALVAGDLDGDGRDDLAVGAPYDYQVEGSGTGAVFVFRGASGGLSEGRSSALRGRTGFEPGYDGDFGHTLAVGDLDQDGRLDLVVTSSGDLLRGGTGYPGGVSACYGAAGGPSGCSRLAFDQRLAEARSIAVGNVSGTERPEIVLGVPAYDDKLGGRVQTLALSGTRGATTVRRSELTQDSKGVRGSGEKGDEFGGSVALGDLDRDGFADLVVGAPGEDKDKGRVTVVHGGPTGYRTSGGLIYDQDTKGIPGKAEKNDRFGDSLALADHDGDGYLDLTVGAPRENGGDGAVTLLRGARTDLTTKAARTDTLAGLGYRSSDDAGFGDVLGR